LIISINAEKVFGKIQHHFMIKALRKLEIDRKNFNIIKAIYDKPTASIILKTENIYSEIKNETRVPTIPTPIQYSTGIPRAIRQEEEIKRIQIGKEIVKISLFADDMILYVKDPNNSTQKLLDTMKSFSKVAGYKINLQKP
jgi:hypothetical protein